MQILINIEKEQLTTANKAEFVERIVTQVENQTLVTTSDSDHLVQYATLKYLADCFAKAAENVQEAAVVEARFQYEETLTGAEFHHQGLKMQLKCKPIYDYTHKRVWMTANKQVQLAKDEVKKRQIDLKRTEELLREEMAPEREEYSVSFIPKE